MKDKTTLDLKSDPKVSIIIPTQHRTHLLPAIIDCFNQQTWWNKELLILDDTPNGKEAIEQLQKQYPNILLWHIEEICSIGSKRNQLIQKASGELIAHFDDDDYYAPTYIETLAKALIDSNAELLKLSAWFCLHEATETLGYWDTTRNNLPHTTFSGNLKPAHQNQQFTRQQYESFLIGYGFSYIFQKRIWTSTKFKDISFGEDSQFYENLFAKDATIKHFKDSQGICLHIIHTTNTSRCFPNFLIPNWLAPESLAKAIQGSDRKNILNQFRDYANEKNKAPTQLAKLRNQGQKLPLVSICTITYNRANFLPLLLRCIENQNYPLDRIEWVIADDSDAYRESLEIKTNTDLRIKYKRIDKHISLGSKRNISHELCSGEYIIYMDDDDYYYPERVHHAVDTLTRSNTGVAGSTQLLIYFSHDDEIWLAGPYAQNHATASTFAMTKKFASQHFYENDAMCNEERFFLNDYTISLAQLEPTQTMICISHKTNTFDKRLIRANGPTEYMRPLTPEESKPLLLKLEQAGYRAK